MLEAEFLQQRADALLRKSGLVPDDRDKPVTRRQLGWILTGAFVFIMICVAAMHFGFR